MTLETKPHRGRTSTLRVVISFIFALQICDGSFDGIIRVGVSGFQVPHIPSASQRSSVTSDFCQKPEEKSKLKSSVCVLSTASSSELSSQSGQDFDSPNEKKDTSEKRWRSSGKHENADSLNSELFRLRKQKNGVALAERRLEEAIQEMVSNADAVQLILRDKNSTYELRRYPDEVSFNSILSSYAKNARRDSMAPAKAEQLMQRMQALSEEFPHLQPSIFTVNAVLEAYSKTCTSNNPKRAQQSQMAILRIYRKVQRDPQLLSNAYTNNLVLTSNIRSSMEWQGLERWALEYLDDPAGAPVRADRNTYNQLFQCYAAAGDADKAEALLRKIIDCTDSGRILGDELKANVVWFNLVLKALAASKGSKAATKSVGDRADELLRQMYDLYKSGYGNIVHPDTSTYNHVLNVHTSSGNTKRAEILVDELEQAYLTKSIDGVNFRPDRVTLTTLIKVYASKQRLVGYSPRLSFEIAQNATKVFERMVSLSNAGWDKMSPNDVAYNTLINIWTNVGTREALNMASEILQKMSEDPEYQPDSVTYTTLIHGWSRGVRHLVRLPEAGYRAEQLLQQLEQLPPSRQRKGFSHTTVYNSVITAWSKSGEPISADKVEGLLSRLEGKYFSGVSTARPTKTTFLCMIGAYAKSRIPDAAERCDALLTRMSYYRDLDLDDLEPDQAIYNAILNALAKSSQPSAVEKAEEILTMMQTSPDPRLKPNIITYSTVMDCHTKCGEGSFRRAEELLRFVEGTYRSGDETLQPNAVFYSAILQAWAKSASPKGAQKAEELLRRNIALYEEGYEYAKPHAIVYNAVMDAIARSGDPTSGSRADDLLQEMEALYQAGDDELKPSRRSYNAVILAYRNAGDGGKKAEEVLERMEKLAASGRPELTPDVVSYNCVISAIVGSNDDDDDHDDSADRAQALLDRMEERRIQPDGRTYSPVIEAWLKRKDEKGHALAEMMLQQFLEKVDSTKKHKSKPGKNPNLYEEAVWDVINAYRKSEEQV